MLESIYLTKSKVRSRLLGILFSSPEHKYYLSELARLAECSVGNAQRELDRFVGDELLLREKKGSLVFYFLNIKHALYPELRSLILKTTGIEGQIKTLVSKKSDIKLTLLYGSFARGEEKGESDIDLLLVSDENLEKFYSALSRLENQFHREINCTAYSTWELKKKIETHNTFVTQILKNPYKILKGDLRDFQKTTS